MAASSRSTPRRSGVRGFAPDIEDQIDNEDCGRHGKPLQRIRAMAFDAEARKLPIAHQAIGKLVVLLDDDRLQIESEPAAIALYSHVLPQLASEYLLRQLKDRWIRGGCDPRNIHFTRGRRHRWQPGSIGPCRYPAALHEHVAVAAGYHQRAHDEIARISLMYTVIDIHRAIGIEYAAHVHPVIQDGLGIDG